MANEEMFLGGSRVVHKTFESTSLSAATYDKLLQTLDVEFTHGARYRYKGVPESVVTELFQAPSAGKFFHTFVKRGAYTYEKL